MKDRMGLYYYPFPENKRVRMYVRQKADEIEFRMKNDDDPVVWNKHGWIAYSAIQQAQVLYAKRGAFDPHRAYDLKVAKAVLAEEDQEAGN
ncbi:hypothetical protein LJC71_08205 [Desulfosarcina sp. OttesenSCG-928-A07]|nr:hypothetical protein [Desulfosarcina sp. OttesenSCG-928-G17]MDL2329709.1 hypothetical protein [Desulfosarcina sp. OttesenSCG-928-A07]